MESLDPRPRRNPVFVAGRVASRVFARGISALPGLGLLVVRHKLGTLAVAVLAVALLWVGTGGFVQGSQAHQATVTSQPAAATESFWHAWHDGSAQEMWDSLSEELQVSFATSNGGVSGLQQQLDQARATGVAYEQATFIAGYPLDSGQTVYFYVASRQGPAGPDQVPFTFTVDQNGKIERIE